MGFFIGAVVLPLALTMIGAAVRAYKKAPQTAATDLLVVFIIFDATIALDAEHVSHLFALRYPPSELILIGVVGAILAVAIWHFCLYEVEPRLIENHFSPNVRAFPLGHWSFAWASSMIIFASHVALFTGRII